MTAPCRRGVRELSVRVTQSQETDQLHLRLPRIGDDEIQVDDAPEHLGRTVPAAGHGDESFRMCQPEGHDEAHQRVEPGRAAQREAEDGWLQHIGPCQQLVVTAVDLEVDVPSRIRNTSAAIVTPSVCCSPGTLANSADLCSPGLIDARRGLDPMLRTRA